MRTDKIGTYNNPKQNFKALRLKKAAEDVVSFFSKKILDKVDTVGESIADTKFYHLYIDKQSFYINHINGDRFYLPINIQDAGKVLIIKARQGIYPVSKKLVFKTEAEVQNACEKIKAANSQFERTAVITKILDEYEQKITKTNSEIIINPTDSKNDKVEKLIKKYGV